MQPQQGKDVLRALNALPRLRVTARYAAEP